MRFFSILIYDVFIRLYAVGIAVASPFNAKAKQWLGGRKRQHVVFNKPGPGKTIWFHCASLGEFEQARPVIEGLKKQAAKHYIILSFFSPSGYEIRKDYEFADKVFYLPIDTSANAAGFIEAIKPDIALFAKYEFWFHYLDELHKRNIPALLFSSVFRKEQVFFRWYGGLFREMLGKFSQIFVQDEGSQKLLASIAIPSQVAFDTRFDRVNQHAQNRKMFPLVEKFKGTAKIFIAGSTWTKDDELIVRLINENVLPGSKFIIAPHNINKAAISALRNACKKDTLLFSELNENNFSAAEALIVDNVGNLSLLYAYADIAYVGGGFNAGIHNVLEAAVFGLPVLFGPRYGKFIEAHELLACGGALSIDDYEDLVKKINLIKGAQTSFGIKAKTYVQSHLGGSTAIIDAVR